MEAFRNEALRVTSNSLYEAQSGKPPASASRIPAEALLRIDARKRIASGDMQRRTSRRAPARAL